MVGDEAPVRGELSWPPDSHPDMEVLEETLGQASPPLFAVVMAHNENTIRAFEENAVDYLPGFVLPERLGKSLERVRGRLASRMSHPARTDNGVGMNDMR